MVRVARAARARVLTLEPEDPEAQGLVDSRAQAAPARLIRQ